MKELRCKKCNKLLCKHDGQVEVKCPRCKTMNSYQLTIKILNDAKDKMFGLGEYKPE